MGAQRVRDGVYRLIVALGTGYLRLMDVRRTVRGAEHVPAEGGVVLAISHFSYVDFVLSEWVVWRSRRRYIRFLATKASFDNVASGPLMSAMRHIPVDRAAGASAYRFAVTALRQGEIVGVFPETRVSGSFTLLPFKKGAARMAAQSGCPIVPCVVWGSHRIMTRTRKTPFLQARHTPVQIVFGEPLHVQPEDDPATVTETLHRVMTLMIEEAMDRDELTPGAWWVPAHRGGGAAAPEPAVDSDTCDEMDERKAS